MYLIIATIILCAIVAYFSKFNLIGLARHFAIKFYMKRKLDTDEDYKLFNDFFDTVRTDLKHFGSDRIDAVNRRLGEVVTYSVPDGKKFRGLISVKAYKHFTKGQEMTPDMLNACHAVGWFLELMQAGCLIYDDIMDESETRRGKQCWYRYNNNGIMAINDGSFLRMISFQILRKYCGKFPYYMNLLDHWWNTSNGTMHGQVLDCLTTPEGKQPDFKLLTDNRYATIVKYKTTLYTFVAPIRMAMYLANITNEEIHLKTEEILIRIGHLFQAQDDYLDVYGDPKITGKVGTDIEDGKCSWIAVKAYQKMDEKQKEWFEQCYGRKDAVSVRIVRKLFNQLEMKNAFMDFEESEYKEITQLIKDFNFTYSMDFKVLDKALNLIYKRVK